MNPMQATRRGHNLNAEQLLQRHEFYRQPNVNWLGEIPSHWEIVRLKHIARLSNRKNEDNSYDTMLSVSSYHGVITRPESESHLIPSSEDAKSYRPVDPGNLCLNVMWLNYGGLGVSSLRGYVSPAYRVYEFHSSKVVPQFIHHLLRSTIYIGRYCSLMYGIRPNSLQVSTHDIDRLEILLPPIEEQQAIASFLDRETSRIDSIIQLKQRQIELLEEKRVALISQAVTKGLDPNVKMKDSGVEWFGEIPEHWRVMRLRHIIRERLSYGANEPAEHDEPTWPRYIRITDIDNSGDLRQETFKSLPPEVAEPYLLQDGDILLARSGATVGKCFIYRPSWGSAAYAGYLIRARVDKGRALPGFVYNYCSSASYLSWLSSARIQATIENVSAERYADLPIPIPPLSEQTRITEWSTETDSSTSEILRKVSNSISLLAEYRQALISAAVTGQIDVRGEVSAP